MSDIAEPEAPVLPISIPEVRFFDQHTSMRAWMCCLLIDAMPAHMREGNIVDGNTESGTYKELRDGLWAGIHPDTFAAVRTGDYASRCASDEGRLYRYLEREFGYNALDLRYCLDRYMFNSDFPNCDTYYVYAQSANSKHWVWMSAVEENRGSVPYPIALINQYEGNVIWEVREHIRIEYNQYIQVPWAGSIRAIPGHYVHVSNEDMSQVAFTENDERGKQGRKLRLRPGRYLKRFYPHMTDDEVTNWATQMLGNVEVEFAKTGNEMEEVYCNGPNSCMAHPASEFHGPVHPVQVYAAGDLELAYIRGNKKSGSKYAARALVWPEKKKVGRIYGDIIRMKILLAHKGFDVSDVTGSALEGARILKIRDDEHDCYVMPYIDGTQSYGLHKTDKNMFVIGGDGDACWTTGLDIEEPESRCTCDHCGESDNEDNVRGVMVTRYSSEMWCNTCVDDHAVSSDRTGRYFAMDEAVSVWNIVYGRTEEQTWASWEADESSYMCDGNDQYYSRSVPKYELEDGRTVSKDFFDEKCVEVNGLYYEKGQEPEVTEEEAKASEEAKIAQSNEPAFTAAKEANLKHNLSDWMQACPIEAQAAHAEAYHRILENLARQAQLTQTWVSVDVPEAHEEAA